MKEIYVLGFGGHSKSIMSCAIHLGMKPIYCYFGKKNTDLFKTLHINDVPNNSDLIIGIGDNLIRAELYDNYMMNFEFPNIIASLFVGEEFKIGRGNFIGVNSYVGPNVKIGNNNIINTSSIIEHDVTLGDFCHISVSSCICGSVTIGDRVFVGANATIIDGINIVSDVLIAAGSTVISNISESGVYVGNPVRKIKDREC